MRKIKKILLIIFILTIFILTGCKSNPKAKLEITDPSFEVVSIAVIQADIVVTEFETILKITNSNNFALELKSLTYELFGKGASWAKGSVKDILRIPAEGSAETRFVFEMNFINMSRSLLDDVVAMRQVQYRFKGNAEVHPALPRVQPFVINYDCSGLSEVKRASKR
ncbi:MAG: LEA type 2 family protein [Treponema sp.]|nr:LEA type 2 family protein [Treponema sp.]